MKVQTIAHEILHGLGVTHLGGGNDGNNAINDGHFSTELMALWSINQSPNGFTSSKEDAATLALAGLTYRKPTDSSQWLLSEKFSKSSVTYHIDGTITADIPYGTEIDYKGEYMNHVAPTSGTATISANYNLYTVDDSAIKNKTINKATFASTTLWLDLIGKDIHMDKHYNATNGVSYYSFDYEGTTYVINSHALTNINES